MYRYDPKSLVADEFINHQEILDTLAYADQHKDDLALVDEILQKAEARKGLSHRDASVLLACEDPERLQRMYALAEQIKKDFYGNRIVIFAPLYLSNYCVNGCVYCPYHMKNKHIPARSSPRRRWPRRSSPCRIWATSGWPSRRASIRR